MGFQLEWMISLTEFFQVYDLHGVWPPPNPEPNPTPAGRPRASRNSNFRHHRYDDPFSRDPFHNEFVYGGPFGGFMDPFAMFERVFGDRSPFDHHTHFERSGQRRRHPSEHAFADVHNFHSSMNSMMNAMERDLFGSFGRGFGVSMGHDPFFSSPTSVGFGGESDSRGSNGNGARWASRSVMTQTINGVTQSVEKNRDWEVSSLLIETNPKPYSSRS
jgi:DnaJ homolog subfamily B member 6